MVAGADDGYLPIEDHGAIGNLRTVVLVGLDGSIDWCCLPDLDSPSVFASLLDHERGGRFTVRARGARRGEQRYLPDTNVLETSFGGDRGTLVVTDFMPLSGSIEGACGDSPTEPAVHRLLRAVGGAVRVELEWAPRFDYARGGTEIMATDQGFLAWSGDDSLVLHGVLGGAEIVDEGHGPAVRAEFELADGEERAVLTRWGPDRRGGDVEEARRQLEDTIESWRSWLHKGQASGEREWAAPHGGLIERSELALKLLTHADTGAIAAAATTSLPEEIGGVRNWDYRYSWIRDAALGAQALFALGHRADGLAFIEWAEAVAREQGERSWGLQIVYGLRGGTDLTEAELTNLEGYRRSSPVRIGNGAVDQLQLDIYGELISAAYEVVRNGEELSEATRAFLPTVADEACRRWQDPDYGLWEIRGGPDHFVYSKVMVWMALDRAIRLGDLGVIDGDLDLWRRSRTMVRDEVLDLGFDTDLGSFRQSYGRDVLDASNLLIPLMEFLPFDDPRAAGTIEATRAGLIDNGLLRRYVADDGVAGGEGGFVLCTLWLVDALALSGRVDEAYEIFEGVVGHANHVGLFAEQIDPSSGAFLGNFPQAFSHTGLINSALYLAHVQDRDSPVPEPIGSDEHRAHLRDGRRTAR